MCEQCRRLGLERERRCGWLDSDDDSPKTVWVSRHADAQGGRLSLSECPVSYISGPSWSLVEEFVARRRLGRGLDVLSTDARTVDAMSVLTQEAEVIEAKSNGE